MHKWLKPVLLIVFISFFSFCSDSERIEKEIKDSVYVPQYTDDSVPLPGPSNTYTEEVADTLRLDFGEFKLYFPLLTLYDSGKVLTGRDTVSIYPDLESNVDSQLIYFDHSLKDLSIIEQYQTTVTIQDEGPHVELYEWKNYQSPWTALDSVSPLCFRMKWITVEEAEKFPEFTREELTKAAKLYADDYWAGLIKKPSFGTWKDQFRIGVGIRRIKINGISETGKVINKLIVIYPPMGC